MTTTRIGKIARLPHFLREQLNRRLADGETGATLVQWLNESVVAKDVLATHFNGKPIREQNLSEWRQGGYQEWLRNQELRAETRRFLSEAEELEEEIGETALTDRMSERLALELLRLLHEAETETGPNRRKAVLEIVRELQWLRRGDHQMERVRMDQQRWDAEQDAAEKAEMEEKRKKVQAAKIRTQVYSDLFRKEYVDGMNDGTLTPEREASIREYFSENAEWLRKSGVPDLPPKINGTPAPPHQDGGCEKETHPSSVRPVEVSAEPGIRPNPA